MNYSSQAFASATSYEYFDDEEQPTYRSLCVAPPTDFAVAMPTDFTATVYPSQFKPAHKASAPRPTALRPTLLLTRIPPPPVLRRCVGGRVTCAVRAPRYSYM